MTAFLASVPFNQTPAPLETYTTLGQALLPFLPAILVVVLAVAIEGAAYWTHKSTRLNWWYPIAMASIVVFVIIWESWSRGNTMLVLVDSPEPEGLRFRLQLLGYGTLASVVPLWMTYLGSRQSIEEYALSGFPVMLARLLPAPAILAILLKHFVTAIDLFSGIDFKLFQ